MRRCLSLFIWLVLATCLHAQDKFSVAATLDRPDGLYKCGEEAVFSLIVKNNDAPVTTGELAYNLSMDGAKTIAEGKAPLGEAPTVIKGTLTDPGILRLTITAPLYCVPMGAGFDVDEIQPTCVEPEDFAAYWEEQKALVRAIPAHVQLEQVDAHSNAQQTTYKISIANISDTRQYGWISVPDAQGEAPGKHPAILTVPAAGWRPYGPAPWYANSGFLSMVLFAHPYPVDLPTERYDELERTDLAGYYRQGRESRDSFYFRRVFMGCTRFMDYLMSRPDWDGKNLIVTGSSQGGALSLICAGLEPKVSAISANVPAMCDHSGCMFGRACGWPGLVPNQDPSIAKVSAYYDAVNFARHAKCASLVSTGFADTTCPPTSVYAAFAALPEPKRMFPTPWMGHAQDPEFGTLSNDFIQGLGKLP